MLMTFSNCSFSFIERNYKSIIEPVTESDVSMFWAKDWYFQCEYEFKDSYN